MNIKKVIDIIAFEKKSSFNKLSNAAGYKGTSFHLAKSAERHTLRLQWVLAIAKETNHEVVIRDKETKKEYIIK